MCEIVDSLVRSDAVFVEAAELVITVVDNDIMAENGEPVRTGEPRRTSAHNGDFLAARLCA